jgi:hypothetical protein
MAGDFFMRICWRGIAGVVCLSLASLLAGAEEIESDVFASMAGKCNTLTIAERNFTCASMAFSHSPGGRSAFTVPLNDPEDENHIVTFSGENGQREQDSLYVLAIDRVLLKSKDSAKAGACRYPSLSPQRGNARKLEISRCSGCPAWPVWPPMGKGRNMSSNSSRMAHPSR